MPDDLKERLKAFVPQPAQAKINSVDEIPAVIQQQWERFNWQTDKQESGIEDIPLEQRQMERAAQNDLIAVLRLINVGKVSVSDKTRYPTATTQKEIVSLLSGGDYYTDPPPEERKPYEQLIACAEPALAVLIANDSRTKPYCLLAGDRSLVVPTASETKFRNALLKLGYTLPK